MSMIMVIAVALLSAKCIEHVFLIKTIILTARKIAIARLGMWECALNVPRVCIRRVKSILIAWVRKELLT